MRHSILSLGLVAALNAIGVLGQTPACVSTCTDNVRNEFAQYSCSSATDAACLCASNDFNFGIRDCSQSSCGATDAQVASFLSTNFCQGLMAASSAPSAAPASSSPPPSSSAAAASTSAAPATTSAAPATTSAAPSTSVKQTPLSQSSSTPASSSAATVASTPTPSAALMPSSTPAMSPSNTGSVAAATSSSSSTSSPAGGLSEAATIGIGVGVGVAAIAFVAIVLCVFIKRRNRTTRPRAEPQFEISKPLPGSGRTYPSMDHSAFEKYAHDIEMTSHRYDDMPPRQTPRTMV